jgi:hypothetical protein
MEAAMPFTRTLRRLVHAAAALSVLLTLWSHLPLEWRSEMVHLAIDLGIATARDAGAAVLRVLSELVRT